MMSPLVVARPARSGSVRLLPSGADDGPIGVEAHCTSINAMTWTLSIENHLSSVANW